MNVDCKDCQTKSRKALDDAAFEILLSRNK
jgi:hypothetical protein